VNLYEVFPATSETLSLTTPDDRQVFSRSLAPSALPWVRAIMVTDSAGQTVDAGGSSRELSHGADRTLLGLYREAADIVLVGASTLRAEPVPTPRSSVLGIVSASGNLDGHKLVVREHANIVVLTTPHGATRVMDSLSGIPFTPVIVDTAIPFISEQLVTSMTSATGGQHFLVEGGRGLWETMADITDEVCISVTPPPLDNHGGIPSWWPSDTANWSLTSLLSDDEKMLYFRYQTGIRGAPLTGPEKPTPTLEA
jgi:riboflavin biosynthesis pyrimidine reductase